MSKTRESSSPRVRTTGGKGRGDGAAGFRILDDFRRFTQKDDVFRRSWWDESVRSDKSRLFYRTYREPLENWRRADGFTQKD